MLDGVFIHPTALVKSDQVGEGTRIWAFGHVMQGARIGAQCNLGDHCFVESGAVVGDGVTIKNGCMVWDGVTLEDGVFVGPGVVFTNDRYPRSARLAQAAHRYRDHDWLVPTVIRRGASLGAASVILAGVVVGEYAMVGAGALAVRDVPDHALVIGAPAEIAGWVCCCGLPLALRNGEATCDGCGLHLEEKPGGVGLRVVADR